MLAKFGLALAGSKVKRVELPRSGLGLCVHLCGMKLMDVINKLGVYYCSRSTFT